MRVEPKLERHVAASWGAALLAAIMAIGVFASVLVLFSIEGRPMERLAVAERVCSTHIYASERDRCERRWLAAQRASFVASK